MTTILVGDRSVALAKLRKLSPVRFIHPDESRFDNKGSTNEQNDFRWMGREREHLVWIDPPADWDPKGLKPHPRRHLVFTSTEKKAALPAAWKKWAQTHQVELQNADLPSNAMRVKFLLSGKAGIPFTKEAAEILTTGYPGSLDALFLPIQALKWQGLEKVTAEDASSVCWRGEEIQLANAINRALGTQKALTLARTAPKGKAYGALKYLEKTCQASEDRIECMDLLLAGIETRRWTPWMALQLFVHFCYNLKRPSCPSPSRTGPSFSETIRLLCLISGIPSPPSATTPVLKTSS